MEAFRASPSRAAVAGSGQFRAVAVGLGMAFRLSARLGFCDGADAERVAAHLAGVGLAAEPGMLNRRFSAARLIGHMKRDKKNRDGRLRFVLARGIGEAFTSDGVEEGVVTEFLRAKRGLGSSRG